jgi:hypothetical protein
MLAICFAHFILLGFFTLIVVILQPITCTLLPCRKKISSITEQTPCMDPHISKRINCTCEANSSTSDAVWVTLPCIVSEFRVLFAASYAEDSIQQGQLMTDFY